MLVGFHLSIRRGFAAVVDSADALGITALQIFTHNASAWRMRPIESATAVAFQRRLERSSLKYVVVHTGYLLNLASPDESLFERSVAALTEEISRAGALGIARVVTHLGAHVGSGREAGMTRIIAGLEQVIGSEAFARYPFVHLLLENTAGAGTTMGATFSELGKIISKLSDSARVGVCLDTCHAFAAGYDLRDPTGLEATLAEFERRIGLARLELIHLNDSAYPLGSRRDRHAHIGRGNIGESGIANIINHPNLRDLPFILETPRLIDGEDADPINLRVVWALRRESDMMQ